MGKLTVRQIVEGSGGKLICGDENHSVIGVCQDSREFRKGYMFTAVKGENSDGHRFIRGLVENGCDTFMVTSNDVPELQQGGVNVILVEDSIKAMQSLARYYLSTLDARIIAVTGSVGKTSTRDILYSICSQAFKTGRSMKNYNNEIGLPISILAFDNDIEVAILEMGMYYPGEIDMLAELVRPDMAIITGIGNAHIENFENQDGIFDAKTEIVNYFDSSSVLAIPGDDKYFREYSSESFRVIKVGEGPGNDLIIRSVIDGGEDGVRFELVWQGAVYECGLPVLGRHNALNASLAAALALQLGETMEDIVEGMARADLTGRRLAVKKTDRIKVIDDSYNANPASMKAAIDVLAGMKFDSPGGRRIAVLGDMFELGAESPRYHMEVGTYAACHNVDKLIAIGGDAVYIREGALKGMDEKDVLYFTGQDAFIAELSSVIREGDVVLVKASNSMNLGQTAEEIFRRYY